MALTIINHPERQKQQLLEAKEQTGLSLSELLRRMMDHCLTTGVMNELVPSMSGRLEVRAQR